MELTLSRLFRARWSEDINNEWIQSLASKNTHYSRELLEDRKNDMNAALPQASVTGYEALTPCLSLPDEDDRHVLAAAIVGRCDVIVTFNVDDFPASTLNCYGIEVQNPDEFLCYQYSLNETLFLSCIKRIRVRLRNPVISADEYIAALRRCNLEVLSSDLDKASTLI